MTGLHIHHRQPPVPQVRYFAFHALPFAQDTLAAAFTSYSLDCTNFGGVNRAFQCLVSPVSLVSPVCDCEAVSRLPPEVLLGENGSCEQRW